MSDKKNFSIPSELRLSQKWDSTIENFLVRPALGLAIGGLFGVVAFSKFYHLSCDSLVEFLFTIDLLLVTLSIVNANSFLDSLQLNTALSDRH